MPDTPALLELAEHHHLTLVLASFLVARDRAVFLETLRTGHFRVRRGFGKVMNLNFLFLRNLFSENPFPLKFAVIFETLDTR